MEVRVGLHGALLIFLRVPRGNISVDIVTGAKHGPGYLDRRTVVALWHTTIVLVIS